MMQTAAVQKISEQNSPYKAMLDRAYMIGYTDAMNQERSHRRAARERRERKKYFAMQKLNGVALLIFTAVTRRTTYIGTGAFCSYPGKTRWTIRMFTIGLSNL